MTRLFAGTVIVRREIAVLTTSSPDTSASISVRRTRFAGFNVTFSFSRGA